MPSQPSVQQQRRRHHQPSMQLQGPRPATLKVTSDSKRRRPPVIIYVESPKVVHAHPGEFKSVVQRLTGAPPPSASPSAPPPPPLQFPFHLYGQLPLAVVAAAPGSSWPAADAAGGHFFMSDHHQRQSMVAANNSLVLPPSSLDGAFYHRHGDLFVNPLQ